MNDNNEDPRPEAKPQTARNVLPAKTLIALTDWARANRTECATWANSRVAAAASAALGTVITVPNVVNLLDALDIAKAKPKAPPTLEERLAELETIVSTHGLHIAALELKDAPPYPCREPKTAGLLIQDPEPICGTDTDVKPHSESPSLPVS
jgi:hypothetical protein